MTSKIVLGIAILAIIGGAAFFFAKDNGEQGENPTGAQINTETNESPQNTFNFSTPQKSAHYETNTPTHGAILAAAPLNVVIDFNFDLAEPSAMSVTKDGKEYATGSLTIDRNKLSMRRNFDQTAPDGLYKVIYKACWPDRSCHDGHFEFAIDRTKQTSYQDMTGQQEVTIKMSDIAFKPSDIKISSGTKITWVNDEEVEHYINTDSHPAHTYHLAQNSRALKLGESYSVVLTQPGIYPYHCSAHADVMVGNIIVI